MQNYYHNANGDVHLTVKNLLYFSFFEFKVSTFSFGKKNPDQLFSLRKIFLYNCVN